MRAVFAVALLLATEPASAHCYSVWKYPWRQPCGATVQLASRTPPREDPKLDPPLPPEAPPVRLDFEPPSMPEPPEGWTDEALRAFAIQKLREKMGR